MLIVVSEKRESWIFIDHLCLEHAAVPGNHLIEAPRLINHVRKLHRLYHRCLALKSLKRNTTETRPTPAGPLASAPIAVRGADVAQISRLLMSTFDPFRT